MNSDKMKVAVYICIATTEQLDPDTKFAWWGIPTGGIHKCKKRPCN